ncbi:MAG: hypothetical protein LBP53_03270 [Candidatus Peribacteria bacterium]|jgi:hypothetical protein|nr:hypothetical protein [Candidatus Peribacteria bacterium]
MNLYIQTSLYQDNKYVPHLLEHCVLFSQERSDFFTYYNGVEGTTFYGYTDLEFTAPLTVDEVLHKITQPISLATFSFQKRVIADELKNATYSQKLREKFYQVLANTPQIVANKVQKGISLELLNAYQKEWYQEQHMLLIKDDEQIDFTF